MQPADVTTAADAKKIVEERGLKQVTDTGAIEAIVDDIIAANPEQAAKVKIDSSRVASHLLVEAMEICGGVAGLDEFGLSRHHNDLFVTRVGEGSNRALMTQIARSLLPECGSILQ